MNRLVLIGNGFDLAHGLKTRYEDFIYWYWKQRILQLYEETTNVSDDHLCKLTMLQDNAWNLFVFNNEPRDWYLFHKFLVDPSDMEGYMPTGFVHIKAKAAEGVDILMKEIMKL